MLKLAFSSVATHDWPLDRVIRYADEIDVDGVELRTFGSHSTQFACDPALTDEAKIRRLASRDGVGVCCIATGLSFDERVHPPVIGRVIGDWDRPLRDAKRAIALASQVEAPFVRVYAFQMHHGEKRDKAMDRITERLLQVLDAARNTGVSIVLENAGSFQTAIDLAEFIDRADHPLLGASYSIAVAHAAGEDPAIGANVLGDRLWLSRLKDVDEQGRPCRLGEGVVPCRDFVAKLHELAPARRDAWLVYEWDRAWIDGLADPENVLPGATDTLMSWITARRPRLNHAHA